MMHGAVEVQEVQEVMIKTQQRWVAAGDSCTQRVQVVQVVEGVVEVQGALAVHTVGMLRWYGNAVKVGFDR